MAKLPSAANTQTLLAAMHDETLVMVVTCSMTRHGFLTQARARELLFKLA